MATNTDADRLFHMVESAKEAIEYAKNKKRNDLNTDRQLVHCLVRCLEITGEAASKISEGLKNNNPQIPWERITGMRNRLVHAYFDINLDIVWKTVREELPELIRNIESISS
jgi:uncharacterized protein with HEPN domain